MSDTATLPRLGAIRRTNGIAGQVAYTTTVTYEGETPTKVEFLGSVYNGPVLMVTDTMQVFVTEPSQYGDFGPEWVRRFYGQGTR